MNHPISLELCTIYENTPRHEVMEALRERWTTYSSAETVLYCHQAVMELVKWAVDERAEVLLDFLRPHLKQSHQIQMLQHCGDKESSDDNRALFARLIQPWMVNSSQYNVMGKLVEQGRIDLLAIGKKHMFPEQWDHVSLNLLYTVGKSNNYDAWKILYEPCSNNDVLNHIKHLRRNGFEMMMDVYHDHKTTRKSWTETMTAALFECVCDRSELLVARMVNESVEHIDFEQIKRWYERPNSFFGPSHFITDGAWKCTKPLWDLVLAAEQKQILRQETEQATTTAESKRSVRM